MSGLQNKVIIITGASGGIGCAIAVEFARVGARLCITGRNEQRLNETKLKCVEAGLSEDNILTVIADVTKADEVSNIIAKVIEKFQQIDVLVNNAGSLIGGRFEDTTADVLDEMYNVHVKSVFTLSKAALPHLIEKKGNIVNVSSIAGTRPFETIFAYSAAKSSVNHMTLMMAIELGPKGIRVNSVTPGAIRTDIFIKPGAPMAEVPEAIDQFYEAQATVHPMRRVGGTEEVAKTILFLASDSASFISGAIVPIDGARYATYAAPPRQTSFGNSC